MIRPRCFLAFVAVLAVLSGCKREERESRSEAAPGKTTETISQSENHLGRSKPPPAPPSRYEENANAVSQGKQLFSQYNCVGCHGHGGGGMGPPLMDQKWVYGSAPENIFATIVEGRPNGMPSFGGKIADQQVWELVAYVRSLSGLVPKSAATPRDDHMSATPPEQQITKRPPVNSFVPPSSESQ
jgi:cytochrome c oxidase cbb3-type subunit III